MTWRGVRGGETGISKDVVCCAGGEIGVLIDMLWYVGVEKGVLKDVVLQESGDKRMLEDALEQKEMEIQRLREEGVRIKSLLQREEEARAAAEREGLRLRSVCICVRTCVFVCIYCV